MYEFSIMPSYGVLQIHHAYTYRTAMRSGHAATTPPPPTTAPHRAQGAAALPVPSNRPSEPIIYPKFAAWFGSYNPNTISRKIETPIFQVEKPSTETTATTFSISGIEAQHEQVAMAMHSVTMETRYIPEKQNSNYMYMYINGTTLIIVTDIPAVEGNSQKGV